MTTPNSPTNEEIAGLCSVGTTQERYEAIKEALDSKDSDIRTLLEMVESLQEICESKASWIDDFKVREDELLAHTQRLECALKKISLGLFSAKTHQEEWMKMRDIAKEALASSTDTGKENPDD